MDRSWQVIDDLMGDTPAMRDRAEEYVPRYFGEPQGVYEARLRRGVLYNMLRDAVERIVSRPFARPVTIEGLTDERALAMVENADRRGSSLALILRKLFFDAVAYGKCHARLAWPAIPAEARRADGMVDVGTARRLNARPYWQRIHPRDLIGWRIETQPDGSEQLVQARIMEIVTRPDGDYRMAEYEAVRVITPETEQLFVSREPRKSYRRGARDVRNRGGWDAEQSEWVPEEKSPNPFGKVPILTAYTNQTGAMESQPPFESLAYQTVEHWQLKVQLREILRVASTAILYQQGVSEEDRKHASEFTVASNMGIQTSAGPADADLKYVEHSGQAIEALERAIRAAEERGEALGTTPFVETAAAATATRSAHAEGKGEKQAQAWVREVEQLARMGIEEFHAALGIESPADWSLDINKEFGVYSPHGSSDLSILDAMRARGDISLEDYAIELQRRGTLREDLIPEELVDRAAADLGELLPSAGADDD